MLKLLVILSVGWNVLAINFNNTNNRRYRKGSKDSRQFSLFSIVQFPNDVCVSSSTAFPAGTCFSNSECTSKGGSALGNCAAGFGVCCVFSTSTCGSTISQNCTYVVNPGFPSTYSTTGSCKVTVAKSQSDVCQLRLDFDTLIMNIMPTNAISLNSNLGCCGSTCATIIAVVSTPTDALTVEGQTGKNPPSICGINTGSHMYVETGTGSTDTVSMDAYVGSGATGARQWNIKVTQILCTDSWKAPTGCVQYLTGVSNTVESFGHQSGQLLQTQDYNVCTRQELGYCKSSWQEAGQTSLSGSATVSPDPFSFPDSPTALGAGENSACVNAYVYIAGGDIGTGISTGISNSWCGESLTADGTLVGVIGSSGRPAPVATNSFYLGVFSDSGHLNTNPTAAAASGFKMVYTQKLC